MKKRIALNAFYTLGIIISVIGLKWAITNANYPIAGLLVVTGVFFLYLKINIVKEVRSGLKDREAAYHASIKEEKK